MYRIFGRPAARWVLKEQGDSMSGSGLKNVRQRRKDALAHVTWQQFESLLAACYRQQGFAVEHVGTGASGLESDGGIDLKLRRGDEYLVVQCKHWNAKQVTHNAMHELLGVMLTEGATGAILITSGEFTRAALQKAHGFPQISMIDGDAVRELLGEQLDMLPQPQPQPQPTSMRPVIVAAQPMVRSSEVLPASATRKSASPTTGQWVEHAATRLIDAAEDRIRYGARGPSSRRRRGGVLTVILGAAGAKLAVGVVGLVLFGVFASMLVSQMQKTIASVGQAPVRPSQAQQTKSARPAATQATAAAGTVRRLNEANRSMPVPEVSAGHGASDAELADWKRRNAESMKILEANTPEL
jgi:hypothetical protein